MHLNKKNYMKMIILKMIKTTRAESEQRDNIVAW